MLLEILKWIANRLCSKRNIQGTAFQNQIDAPLPERVDALPVRRRPVGIFRPRPRWIRAIRLVCQILRYRKRWSFFGALLQTRRNSLPYQVLTRIRSYYSGLGRYLGRYNSSRLCDWRPKVQIEHSRLRFPHFEHHGHWRTTQKGSRRRKS